MSNLLSLLLILFFITFSNGLRNFLRKGQSEIENESENESWNESNAESKTECGWFKSNSKCGDYNVYRCCVFYKSCKVRGGYFKCAFHKKNEEKSHFRKKFK